MKDRKDKTLLPLQFDDEFMLDSVETRAQGGDFIGALTLLNKRNQMFPPSADAQALAADIYEELGVYNMAADAWFRFLDICNEADFSEGYEGLAVAFMNMGNDLHSNLYYHRFAQAEGKDEVLEALLRESPSPKLKMVYANDGEAPEILAEGLALLKSGELEEAKETFQGISESCDDYATAVGLSAMCTLMMGNEDEALRECRELLRKYPDNVQALTTYCAVLGAQEKKREAQEVARRLFEIQTSNTDDLYRIATALCETGLDKEAYTRLTELYEKLPNDDNVLYFLAVASYHVGEIDEAIAALERLTTIYPRKAVAGYYLVRLREFRDGGERFPMSYYYRVPEEEYNTVAAFLLAAERAELDYDMPKPDDKELSEFFRIAFDEMEGRDEKLQLLAVRVAVKLRQDEILREVLLDFEGDDIVKLHILHELVMRNEDDSFGTVVCNLYKEFFTHKIDVGTKKRHEFMNAFADVYSKFSLLDEENERKICTAAEDVYATLEDYGALDYCDERASIAAVIYREARIFKGVRSFDKILELFGANKYKTQEILDLLM